jgi:hypothetical protein
MCWKPAGIDAGGPDLLGFLLFLLTDADFEHLVFSFLKSLMIVPGDGIFEVRVDVGVLRQDSH